MYLQSAPGLSMDQPTPWAGKKFPPPNSGQRKFLGTKRPKPRNPFSEYEIRVKKNSAVVSDGESARTNIPTRPIVTETVRASRRIVLFITVCSHCICCLR